MAGHGATQGLPLSGGHLGDYAELMGRVIEELGIRKAVIAGHSMGGRVDGPAGGPAARAHHRRPADRRHRRRPVGLHGQPVPVQPVPADAARAWAWPSTRWPRCRCSTIPARRSSSGRLLAPDADRPRHPAVAPGRAGGLDPAHQGQPGHPRRAGPRRGADVRDPRRPRPDRARSPPPGRRPSAPTAPWSPCARAATRGCSATPRPCRPSWPSCCGAAWATPSATSIGAAGAASRDELEAIFYEPDAPILGLTPPVGPVPVLDDDHQLPRYPGPSPDDPSVALTTLRSETMPLADGILRGPCHHHRLLSPSVRALRAVPARERPAARVDSRFRGLTATLSHR